MSSDWKEWNLKDIIYGIIVPLLVVMLIVGISQLGRLVGGGYEGLAGALFGISMELLELVLLAIIPLMLGLVWNSWAGGASGFLMGSYYALYWADTMHTLQGSGTILLSYILSALLIGYMAGALNKRSDSFRRMLISGVVAATIGAVFLFGVFQLSSVNVVTGLSGLLLTVLPRTACGAIAAAVTKVFIWFGVAINRAS